MIAKNKIISLTIIGVVIGIVLSMLGIGGGGGGNLIALAAICGIVGFIAGWIWQTRTDKAES